MTRVMKKKEMKMKIKTNKDWKIEEGDDDDDDGVVGEEDEDEKDSYAEDDSKWKGKTRK